MNVDKNEKRSKHLDNYLIINRHMHIEAQMMC